MTDDSVYDELGVPTVVNAAGTKTRIGGSRIRPGALDAMERAAESFVRLSDLQAAASDRIAAVTDADAGYVTNGAAGALVLSAAACIAGTDPGIMSRLPDTEGVADEIVMSRTHRTGYDHALRAAGAEIVDIGSNDRYLGTGSRNVEPWEYADAIGEDTAAVAHVYKGYEGPPLAGVCELAHDHDVPVIVDGGKSDTPVVEVTVDETAAGISTVELVRALRREEPRVFVGADALDTHQFSVNPICLTDDEADYVVGRIRANLDGGSRE